MRERRIGLGIGVALLTGATFGTAGPFAKPLLLHGWTPGAVVTLRVSVGALFMIVPTVLVMRGQWSLLRVNRGRVLAYGFVAVALCQFAYFQAVQRISVGVALLLEYLGLLLVVGWMWARHGHRPSRLTFAGTAVAIGGLLLVLNVFAGFAINGVGVLWGLLAACGLAYFFVVSSHEHEETLPPVALAGFGLMVAAVLLWVTSLTGLTPFVRGEDHAVLAGQSLPWWAFVLALGAISSALSYSTGVLAARLVGATLATFLGLSEVLFAALFAWWLLGERPTVVQAVGGLLVIGGVMLVKLGEVGSVEQGRESALLPEGPVVPVLAGPELVEVD